MIVYTVIDEQGFHCVLVETLIEAQEIVENEGGLIIEVDTDDLCYTPLHQGSFEANHQELGWFRGSDRSYEDSTKRYGNPIRTFLKPEFLKHMTFPEFTEVEYRG